MQRTRFAEIWDALERDHEVTFGRQIRERHTPAKTTNLVRCSNCSLESFFPAIPGDREFYRILSGSPSYYQDERWEFHAVAEQLERGQTVLEIGAGTGRFLTIARDQRCATLAIEHNPRARATLSAAGIDVFNSFEEVAQRISTDVDVFCAFQTLEHVADVDAVLSSAVNLLGRGGRLFLSVPNRDRVRTETFEPLDHPPHHLSRWSVTTIRELGDRYGLRLSGVWFEEPDPSTARVFARRRLPGILGRAVGRLISDEPTYGLLHRRRVLTRLGAQGHTMLAAFQVEV